MIPQCGIHPNVPFSHYQQWDAINWHTLWRLREESPAHAKYEMEHGTKETEALAFGSLTDFVLLEPGRFEHEAVVEPEIGEGGAPKRPNKRQLEAKKPSPDSIAQINFWQAWDAENAGKIIVKASDYARVLEIEASVRTAQCREYILGGRSQVVIVWKDPATGLLCKGRLDYERNAGFTHHITDLKTARSAKADKFREQVYRLGYAGQMAFYHDGWFHLTGERSECWWLVAEKDGLCVVKPWQAIGWDDRGQPIVEWIEGGRNLYRPALEQWAKCLQENHWPGYGGPEILEMDWVKGKLGIGPDLIRPEPAYAGGGVPEGKEQDEFDTFIQGE